MIKKMMENRDFLYIFFTKFMPWNKQQFIHIII